MSVSVPSFSLVQTPLSQLETKARAEAGEGPVQTGSPAVPRATGHHRLLSGVLRRTCPARAMVDVLDGRCLVTRGGACVETEAALQNKVVALYFAAARCAPSRDFTPLLCNFYAELVELAQPPAPFAVVFVSVDSSAQEMQDFMRQLPGAWLALPFQDPYRQ